MKPRWLRFRAWPEWLRAEVRRPWSDPAQLAFAALWNLLLPLLVQKGHATLLERYQAHDLFLIVGNVGALVFALLFVRSLMNRTVLTFSGGRFTCSRGPMPLRARVSHPLSDIDRFEAWARDGSPKNGHRFALVTKGGPSIELPLSMDGIIWKSRGGNQGYFGAAPVSHVDHVLGWLPQSLDEARRSGGSYRVAPGEELAVEEQEPEAEAARLRR
jgi:hypothetical protein